MGWLLSVVTSGEHRVGKKNKETFKYHYNLEVSNDRCPHGPGSDSKLVKQSGTIEFINNLIKKYDIKSINDCPSGLFNNWIYLVDLAEVKYSGYDINDIVVRRNIEEHPEISFFEFDLVNEILPYADMVICRDCFFHLPSSFVINAIKNFTDSGAKYLLATEHNWVETNTDLTATELECEAGFRFINLEINPYNLGMPLEIHDEEVWRFYESGNNRQLSLWKLN